MWCRAARSMARGSGWWSCPLCQLEGGLGCPRGGFGWPERALDGEGMASGVQEMVSGGCRVVLGGWEVTVDVREVASSGLGAQEMFFWVAKRGTPPCGACARAASLQGPNWGHRDRCPWGGGHMGRRHHPRHTSPPSFSSPSAVPRRSLLAGMNGTANLTPGGRGHYGSAIPVPRSVPPGKLPAAAPPARHSSPGPPTSHQASSPRLASGPKSLKPKPRVATGHEVAGEPSPGVPPRGGQRPLVPPGKGLEVGKGVAGSLRGPGGRRPLSCSVRGPGGTPEMEDGPPAGSQSRVPVFGSGAISFSSAPPHSRPVTATVAPFQYR